MDLIANADQLNTDEKRQRPYVQVLTGFWPKCAIVTGWAWGYEIAAGRRGMHSGNGHQVLILDHVALRPPASLFNELRRRLEPNSPPLEKSSQDPVGWSAPPKGWMDHITSRVYLTPRNI